MNVYDFDNPVTQTNYVFFKDAKYFYVVRDDVAENMRLAPSGNHRLMLADLVVDLATGKTIKSRFYNPNGTN